MQIKAVIVFPNVASIFHTKSANRSEKIGWITTIWTLKGGGLYWEMDKLLPTPIERFHTLSLDKKKLFASKLAKEFGYKIIYLDKRRANHIIRMSGDNFQTITFRKGDI